MKDLLNQLEKESSAINVASGRKIATQIAESLPAFQAIVEYVKSNKRDNILILEKVEEVVARPIDEQYANPYDNFVFTLLTLLKYLYSKNLDNSGKFNLAQDCAAEMKNSFWSKQVRHNNFLEHLYDICGVSRADAMDELYCTIPDLLRERKFDAVNSILVEMDLTQLPTSIMYGMLNVVSSYLNQLPHYEDFWHRVRNEFMRRRAVNEEERTEAQIDNLIGKYKSGHPSIPRYDVENENRVYKSPEEVVDEKLQDKLAWAKKIGDKDLEDMLKYYSQNLARQKKINMEFRNLSDRLGNEEVRLRTVEALRAMADKLEQPGSHFIIGCELPTLPIFSKKMSEDYVSHISVTLVAGPLGG